MPWHPRLGLVLSGGGSRGLAQIGVLRALEEAGIRPDFIVGTRITSYNVCYTKLLRWTADVTYFALIGKAVQAAVNADTSVLV